MDELESYLMEKATPASTSTDASPDAQSLIGAHRYAEAIDFYSERMRTSPKGHTLYVGRARAYAKMGMIEEALKDVDLAEGLSNNDASIAAVRQEIETLGDEPLARVVRMAIRRNMQDSLRENRLPHAEVYREALARHSSASERILDRALVDIALGRYEDALRTLAEEAEPEGREPRRLLALLVEAARNPEGIQLEDEIRSLQEATPGWGRCALQILVQRHPTNELLNRYQSLLQTQRWRRPRPPED